MKKKIKKSSIEKILYLYIIICPILDLLSFIFRNTLNTKISPSTIIRPIFVLIGVIYIFIVDKKQRKYLTIGGIIYAIYASIHLFIFTKVQNGSSYGGIIHELQYLVNYTFMIVNLYTYLYIFSKAKDNKKLKKCILLSITIYILSIYLSIITGTASFTYTEDGIGCKGWFESGNSLSAIFILSLFILFSIYNDGKTNKKEKRFFTVILLFVGYYLMFKIGTRVGLLGFGVVCGSYVLANVIYNLINKIRVRQTLIFSGILSVMAIMTFVTVFTASGSETLERRRRMENMANSLKDEETNERIYITGDLNEIKKKIVNGTIDNNFMSKEQQKAVIQLNEIATKNELSIRNMRTLQLIYNVNLLNNQNNILYRLFGNGYVSQFYEMILEMEFVSILLNFGIVGFILYLVPFVAIYVYSAFKGIKNFKKIDVEYLMLLLGGGMAFVLSFLSGYIFFNASTTMIIIIINVILFNKAKEMD